MIFNLLKFKIFIILISLLIIIVSGCGYVSRSEKLGHIDSVTISPIGNETLEYDLETDLAEALRQEFRPWGEGTDSMFTGLIKFYEAFPISWDQNNMPEQYRIIFRMSFVFEDLKRNRVLRDEKNYERTYDFFVVENRGQPPETVKEAKGKLVKEVAEEIISGIVEEW